MDSFNKENLIIISQDDISTPLRHKSSRVTIGGSPLRESSNNNNVNRSLRELSLNTSTTTTTTTTQFKPSSATGSKGESFLLADESDCSVIRTGIMGNNNNNGVVVVGAGATAPGEIAAANAATIHEVEKKYTNLLLQNKNLEQENQNLEMELLLKEKELLLKSTNYNELIIAKKNIEMKLNAELKNNELNYSNWMQLRQQYENKINHLNQNLAIYQNNIQQQQQQQQQLPSSNPTIQLLNKKIKSLQSDLELEKNSKMLIIDEYEILKQNFLNMELNYNLLQNQYETLKQEAEYGLGHGLNHDHGHDDEQNEPANCSFDTSYGDDNVEHIYHSNDEIAVNNGDHEHEHGQATMDLDAELLEAETAAAAAVLETPHTPANNMMMTMTPTMIPVAVLEQERFQRSQELIKLNFQIKSLHLQNEKLYSYIGYLLQNSISTSTASSSNKKEYSDEKLIKMAKKKLVNTRILRSVSSSSAMKYDEDDGFSKKGSLKGKRSSNMMVIYPDHATDEEMSLFLNDCYGAAAGQGQGSGVSADTTSSTTTTTRQQQHPTSKRTISAPSNIRINSGNSNKKVLNIKSTANLKKLHISRNSSSHGDSTGTGTGTGSGSGIAQIDAAIGTANANVNASYHYKRLQISILHDLIIGNRTILNRLNVNDVLFNGLLKFIQNNNNNNDTDTTTLMICSATTTTTTDGTNDDNETTTTTATSSDDDDDDDDDLD